MKKYNLKMLALGLIATLAFTSCEVRQNRYNKKPDHHRRDRDHRDNQGRNDNRNNNNSY